MIRGAQSGIRLWLIKVVYYGQMAQLNGCDVDSKAAEVDSDNMTMSRVVTHPLMTHLRITAQSCKLTFWVSLSPLQSTGLHTPQTPTLL